MAEEATLAAMPEAERSSVIRGAMDEAFNRATGPNSGGEVSVANGRKAVTPEAKAHVPSEPDRAKTEAPKEEAKSEKSKEVSEENQEQTTDTTEATTDDGPLDEKGRYKWGELKKENKLQKARLQELEAKHKQAEEASQELARIKSELDQKQKLIDEAHKELYLTRVEATPEWKKGVAEPLNDVITQVGQIAKLTQLDPHKLIDAVDKASKGDRTALGELTENMDTFVKSDLYALSKNLIQIDKRISELKSNSKEAYEASMRNYQEEQGRLKEQTTKAYQKAAGEISEKFTAAVKDILPDDHGIDFEVLKSESQSIDTWTPEERVYAGYAAASLPSLIKQAKTQAQTIRSLQAENAKLRGGAPKSNSTGSAATSPKDTKKTESRMDLAGKSFESLAGETVSRLQGSFPQ